MDNKAGIARAWAVLTSLKLTIACLGLLMVLVVSCTLAQVDLGTWGAVSKYMRSFIVWWGIPGTGLRLPVLPGGATVGLLLGANLIAAQLSRLERSWRKVGIWIIHAGLILLFVGEFVTAAYQVDMQLAIEQGQTLNFLENTRELELSITDTTDPAHDEVYGVPASVLAREKLVLVPGTPLSVKVKRYYTNVQLGMRGEGSGPPIADRGVGANVSLVEEPPIASDERKNTSAALIEPFAGGRSYGTWLVSTGLGAPQSFLHEGRSYALSLRPMRKYLPYSVTLKKFSHDIYPGTDIPKNFSSLVHLSRPSTGEERDVLIYMNQPLRYDGKAFYQASFGKGDTLSILQVVENPGWLLPYISCVLVAAGLVLHFLLTLFRSLKRRQVAAEAR